MRLRALLVVAGIATLAAAAPARAATFTVTGTADGAGSCAGANCTTIRAALTEAARVTGTDTISLPAGAYSVTLGQLNITSTVLIIGASAANTSVAADGKSNRVFSLAADRSALIQHVTIAGGAATSDSDGVGGNILVGSGALLLLDHARVTNGTALRGGGIGVQLGMVQITKSLIDNNKAVTAVGAGGTGDGGGIIALGSAATGGGSTLTLTDSTVAHNDATLAAGIAVRGSATNAATLLRSTVAWNAAGMSPGAGIFLSDGGSVTASGSIVAGNTGDGGASNCAIKITTGGSNIDTGNTCGLSSSTDRQSTNPQITTLLFSAGGETPVLTLPATSPAVDLIPAGSACTGTITDQRDLVRPQGGGCDAGAYEFDFPPDTAITGGPDGLTNDNTPSFTFKSTEANSTFQCRLGTTGTFTTCPAAYGPLADGSYTFQVRAIDPTGNSDATPASRPFTVDATAPAPPAITAPADNSFQGSATVTLSGTAEANSTVEVFEGATSRGTTTANGAGVWTRALTSVGDGVHVYAAKATDAAGNVSPASAARTVNVDTGPPAAPVISSPGALQNVADVVLSGTAEPGSTVEVFEGAATRGTTTTSDGGAWTKTLAGVPDGAHTYTAKATDIARNTSPASAPRTVTIDTTPPPAQVVSGPSGPTTDPAPAFGFSSPDPQTTFVCRLDGPGAAVGTFGHCTSPTSFSGLAPGDYTFVVRATDLAGNQTTTTRSFSVAAVQQATPTPTPVSGKSVVIAPVRGTTMIKKPGSDKFEPVDFTQGIPLGSIVDTRRSKIRLFAVPKPGRPVESALVYGGIFKVTQIGTITQLQLVEALAACKAKASTAAKKPKTRKLWGDGSGSFRTRGQYSAATVRGTRWLVQDSCGKTLTKVAKGVVSVRDFVKRKTVLVRAPKSYTARQR